MQSLSNSPCLAKNGLPGDPAETIYFLHRGKVKLAYLDESGKRLALTICRVGEPFGEMALAGEERRQLIAEALSDVELCMISRQDLLRVAQNHQTGGRSPK